MSADPHYWRLFAAFGEVLVRLRRERQWDAYALGRVAGLTDGDIIGLERGDYGPTLTDFFRFAIALGKEPTILLIDLINAWRADPADTLHPSRPSDFARLFRLGYHHKPGDFRELSTPYYSIFEATPAAAKLNAQRHTRGVALLDTVCVYVRLDYVSLRLTDSEVGGRAQP